MNTTEKTVSIYEGLANVKKCFEAYGEAGRALQAFSAVRAEWIKVLNENSAADDRIRAAYKTAGMFNGWEKRTA